MALFLVHAALLAFVVLALRWRIARLAAESAALPEPTEGQKKDLYSRARTAIVLAALYVMAVSFPRFGLDPLSGVASWLDGIAFFVVFVYVLSAGYPLNARLRGLKEPAERYYLLALRWIAVKFLPILLLLFAASPAIRLWASSLGVRTFGPLADLVIGVLVLPALLLTAFSFAADLIESALIRILFRGDAPKDPAIAELVAQRFGQAGLRAPSVRLLAVSGVGVQNMMTTSHPAHDRLLRPVLFMDPVTASQPREIVDALIAHLAAWTALRHELRHAFLFPAFIAAFSIPFGLIGWRLFRLAELPGGMLVVFADIWVTWVLLSALKLRWRHEQALDADAYAVSRLGVGAASLKAALEALCAGNGIPLEKAEGKSAFGDGWAQFSCVDRIAWLSSTAPPSGWALWRAMRRARWLPVMALFYAAFLGALASLVRELWSAVS